MFSLNHCYLIPDLNSDGVQGGLSGTSATVSLLNPYEKKDDIVTEAELCLLAEWPVPDLVQVLNFPKESLDLYADDFIRFHERAGRVMEALLGNVKTDLLAVRFGVAGVVSDLNATFELNETFLTHLWRHERPISHWVRKEYDDLMEVAVLGRSYALAAASLDVQHMSGMDRLGAIENRCYDAYLRQIYMRAFNLYGIFPLPHEELGIRGIDPWMQVAAGRDIVPARCTGRQLELFARRQFRDFKIPFEVYSILKHMPLRLSIPARMAMTDWVSLLENELSASWLRGETGHWIEKTLDSITDSGNSDSQGYMLEG